MRAVVRTRRGLRSGEAPVAVERVNSPPFNVAYGPPARLAATAVTVVTINSLLATSPALPPDKQPDKRGRERLLRKARRVQYAPIPCGQPERTLTYSSCGDARPP